MRTEPDPNDPKSPPNPNNYNPRVHGLSVRATAIARLIPARTAGPALPNADPDAAVEGLAPFSLTRAFWGAMGDAAKVVPDGESQPITAPSGLTIGARPTAGSASPDAGATYFVALTGSDATAGYVVGFGRVTVTATAPLTIRREAGGSGLAGGRAFRNVSGAVLQSATDPIPADAPLDAIFAENAALPPALAVLAPVLVR